MIGSVILPDGTVASLDDDGRWQTPDTVTAAYLNARFDSSRYGTLGGRLPYGVLTLIETARAMNGRYELMVEIGPEFVDPDMVP